MAKRGRKDRDSGVASRAGVGTVTNVPGGTKPPNNGAAPPPPAARPAAATPGTGATIKPAASLGDGKAIPPGVKGTPPAGPASSSAPPVAAKGAGGKVVSDVRGTPAPPPAAKAKPTPADARAAATMTADKPPPAPLMLSLPADKVAAGKPAASPVEKSPGTKPPAPVEANSAAPPTAAPTASSQVKPTTVPAPVVELKAASAPPAPEVKPAPAPVQAPAAEAKAPKSVEVQPPPPAAAPLEAVVPVAAAAPPPAPPPAAAPSPQPPLLFEIAWEVCWQLGGIYTVLRSKAATMLEKWGDRYCLIGPYNPNTAAVEFEEQPTYGSIRDTMQRMRDAGIPCYFGRWLVAGRPRVILIDYRARFGSLGFDKFLMWQDHGISTPDNDGELNEVVSFGFAVAEFFRHFTQVVKDRPILAHFHEWMGGVAVPRIAHLRLPVATVFTTHATLLGRYIAGDNPYFYEHLPFINPDAEAAKYQIYPRFAIERAAAHASTVFTTVSEVTAVEAEKLLGRPAEVIVPNGLNIQRFAAPHEFQHLHQIYKQRIHEFVMGHFFPSYTFDLDQTLYLVTSGRYEYRNKGMDLFIETLARLNHRLKGVAGAPTVVAFIITRAPTRNVNVDVLKRQTMFDDLRNTCDELKETVGQRLFTSAANGRLPTFGELLPEDSQVRLKRALHAWKSHRQPSIVTHDLADDQNDPILKHLRHVGLFNGADDPVKIVFHPEFVTATSPTISLDYEQFVRGCHMGLFPSYYEPWGYTPMECVALGVPAATTDLSGFGAYVQRHVPDHNQKGILVLDRRERGFDYACDSMVDYLVGFARLNRRQRIELRNNVEQLGELFDWSNLIRHYDEAHSLALQRIGAKRLGTVEVRMV